MLVLDFETKSRCDLLTAGTYNYVADPSTDILCCAFMDTETGEKDIWWPDYSRQLPPKLVRWLLAADLVAAHYAEFDQGIYEYVGVQVYGFPELPREKWYCTAAQCRVNAIPAGLDDAAWALGLKDRKHASGKSLIKALSIPDKDTGLFNLDPQLLSEMRHYCMQDVIVTVGVVRCTRPMTQNEHLDWLKTCEINERGVKCDLELATLALQYADEEQSEIAAKLDIATRGVVTKHTQSQRIKQWLVSAVGEAHPLIKLMTVYKKGEPKLSLDKNIRRTVLEMASNGELPLHPNIVDVIQLLDDGSMSSVSKFKRMLERADPVDGRVRGAFVFAGASQTLRYASRGLQLHNMKRDCWGAEDAEQLIEMMRGNYPIGQLTGGVMQTLAKLMRPAIIPEAGKALIVGDWSSIEARCLHWLTDTEQGDLKLDLFESGADVYTLAAKNMGFDDRQIGKVAELSCGYQGARRALQAMARNYGVKIADNEADLIVQRWRETNWWVVQFWRDLEQAAKDAIDNPLTYFPAGMVKYIFMPDLIDGTLLCIMGGDHIIQYPKARIELVETPWGESYQVTALKAAYKPKGDSEEWPRTSLYGGLFCENICQAFAAALLRNALRKLPDVIAHVHDEIVMEVPEELAVEAAGVLRSVMLDVPEWAEGLPLATEPTIMTRYGK